MKIKASHLIVTVVVVSIAGFAYAAQFWQAYCNTEGKALNGWSNQEKVAQQVKDNHLRNKPQHDVDVNSK